MFIDMASHACNTELVGLETIDLDKTIGIALDFAEKLRFSEQKKRILALRTEL